MKIGFIGAGNMGGAILKGYAPFAERNGDKIFVYDKKEEVRSGLEEAFPAVTACGRETELVEKSDIVILGVKPNLFETLLPGNRGCMHNRSIDYFYGRGYPYFSDRGVSGRG